MKYGKLEQIIEIEEVIDKIKDNCNPTGSIAGGIALSALKRKKKALIEEYGDNYIGDKRIYEKLKGFNQAEINSELDEIRYKIRDLESTIKRSHISTQRRLDNQDIEIKDIRTEYNQLRSTHDILRGLNEEYKKELTDIKDTFNQEIKLINISLIVIIVVSIVLKYI